MAGVNQEFGQKAYNPAGGGEVAVYDSYTDAWHYLGKVTNIRYTPTVEHYDQTQTTSGETVPTQRRVRSRRGALSFVCSEMFDPKVVQFVFGDPEVSQTDAGDNTEKERQHVTLWGTEKQKLGIIDGHAEAMSYGTPSITSATPAADNAGANWTAGTHYLFAVPIWGDATAIDADAATGYSANVDVSFWAGTPSASQSVTITNTDDSVSMEIAAYATSPLDQPDYWVVFTNTSDSITGAEICLISQSPVAGAGYIAFTDNPTLTIEGPAHATTSATYAVSVGCAVQDITSYAATTTYSKLASGTDFTYDSAAGTIVRIAGGSWVDGDECVVTYWVWKPDSVTTSMGARRSGTTTRKFRIRHFEPEIDKTSTDPTTIEGQEIILYRCDTSGITTEISYNEEAFSEGMPVEVEAMFDQSQDKIGVITTYSRKAAGRVAEDAKYR